MKKIHAIVALVGILAFFFPVPKAVAQVYRPPSSTITDGSITSAKITDSTIVNADISASANIAVSKLNLAALSSAQSQATQNATSTFASTTAGTNIWAPLPWTYVASSSSGANVNFNAIQLYQGDAIMLWGTGDRNSCTSRVDLSLHLKIVGWGATTSLQDASEQVGSGASYCNLAVQGLFVATTSTVVHVGFVQSGLDLTRGMYQLLRR